MKTFKQIMEMSAAPTHIDLEERYQYWNNKAFGGLLPKIPITWFKSVHKGGVAKGTMVTKFGSYTVTPTGIMISEFMVNNPVELDKILLHEMVHIQVYISNRPRDGHGFWFEKLRKEAIEKSGVDIPISDDIKSWEFSDNLKEKDFIILVLSARGSKKYQIWNKNSFNKNIESIKEMIKKYYYDWDAEYYTSNDKSINKFTVTRKLGRRIGFYPDSNPAVKKMMDEIMSNAKKVGDLNNKDEKVA